MRRPEVVVLALLVALVGAGCSRVAFIKTEPGRKGFESHERTGRRPRKRRGPQSFERAQLARAVGRAPAHGRFVAAEKYARQALKSDPNSVGAYTLLAVIADGQGQPAQAGQHYKRASELAPTDGRMLNNYGTWLCKNGQAQASLDWFDRALQAPGYATPAAALANSGSCALDVGDNVRADRDLRQALAITPENPVALAALARLQYRSGNYLEARAFSERRLAAAPADAEALILASQIEDKLGDSAAAARYVRRLGEEFPGAAQGNAGDRSRHEQRTRTRLRIRRRAGCRRTFAQGTRRRGPVDRRRRRTSSRCPIASSKPWKPKTGSAWARRCTCAGSCAATRACSAW